MAVRILLGDCRTRLKELPSESVHCVVTSPPYFNLRDYQVAGQLGLEASPDAYVAELVAVFREVRRVLRSDGTAWINLGDSYASSTKGSGGGAGKSGLMKSAGYSDEQRRIIAADRSNAAARFTPRRFELGTAKPKDLLMMPARVALALQADGWWLRSDIIWSKPNPLPESVTDRPTSAHEHVFLLVKSERYFFDADAVREPYNEASIGRYATPMQSTAPTGRQPGGDISRKTREEAIRDPNPLGRNIRNVWTVATQPYSGSHFATMPPALIEPCIKAGTSEKGCCAKCGAPWRRITNRVDQGYDGSRYGERAVAATGGATSGGTAKSTLGSSNGKLTGHQETVGWSPSCACAADVVPCTVLDPFFGAGTTGLVADWLGRDCIGIELSPAYAKMAQRRIDADCPLFAEVVTVC